MNQGQVKKFFEDKNFGFISTPDGDVFFHISGCVEGYQPREGDEVSFTIWANERTGKTQAQDVQVVEAE